MTAIVRGDDAPRFSVGESRVTGQASPARGSKEIASWRVELDPGVALLAHTHDHEEVLHILRGPVLAHVDGRAIRLQAGDALIIPAGALHQVSNDAGMVAEGLAVVPAGTRFILEDGTDNGVPPWVQ